LKADKETKIILSWIGINPDEIDLEQIYSSPKFWLGIVFISIVIALVAVFL